RLGNDGRRRWWWLRRDGGLGINRKGRDQGECRDDLFAGVTDDVALGLGAIRRAYDEMPATLVLPIFRPNDERARRLGGQARPRGAPEHTADEGVFRRAARGRDVIDPNGLRVFRARATRREEHDREPCIR